MPPRQKNTDDAVAHLKAGRLLCGGCKKLVPLEGQPPLTIAKCAFCNRHNFIPLRVGGFWLVEPLGGGGMGSVYKACHEDKGEEEFAVKVLPRGELQNQAFINNLLHEAELCKHLSGHPCLVNFVDSGFDNSEHYMATEFISGERLDKRIEARGRLPEHEVLALGLRLLSAEAHICQKGYLYRDMKPENVIITKGRGAVLYDYGICMTLEDAIADQGDTFEGSPLYFPPERVLGEGERPYSEIYSLGMVMYHTLTGKPYFSSDEVNTIARQHLSFLRLLNKGAKMKNIRADLAEVIDRMIKRNPVHRYQSFIEVEHVLFDLLMKRVKANPQGMWLG